MDYQIKQLTQNSKIIFPQTVAEAVAVKHGAEELTLDKVLNRKIEKISNGENSDLQISTSGTEVIITHANKIIPNETTLPLNIKYDKNGHIIETSVTKNLNVIIQDMKVLSYNGLEESSLNFSDSFKIEDNKIEINWNEINNGNT